MVLFVGYPYMVKYYDHFEHDDALELIIEEVGFYLGENERYYFFASYRCSEGSEYNRTGIMKSCVISLEELTQKEGPK